MIAATLNGPFALWEDFQGGNFGIWELIIVVLYPFGIYLSLFLAPTLRVKFSDWGINATWKVGIGRLKIWEQKNYRLRWEDLTAVYQVFPRWVPIHIIGVAGYQHDLDKARNFFIGFATTKKKESLLYIADHVPKQVLTDEVQVLVNRYRKQKEQEKRACPE